MTVQPSLKASLLSTLALLCFLGAIWMPAYAQDIPATVNQPLVAGNDISLTVTPVAPDLKFTHLSVADGLSQSDVRAIVQDPQGFMWFGTWMGGLNRYDGYTFKTYKHDPDDERSISTDSIGVLYVDRGGDLWVGTSGGGVDRYDRETDAFVHYRPHPDDPSSLPGGIVWAFYEDESGTLWVGTYEGGLSRFDRRSDTFFTYRPDPNDPTRFGDTEILTICLDQSTGLLWLGTLNNGVSVFDRATGHFSRYTNAPGDPASLSHNTVHHIFQDRAGSLWFATGGGLSRWDPHKHTFTRYVHDPQNPASLSDDFVVKTYEDRAGRFWVVTNNGLNLMDRTGGTFVRYLNEPDNPDSLSSNAINGRAFYEDASGALWIGTRSTGVDQLTGEAEKFATYRHNPRDPNSLGDKAVTSLFVGSTGELWIGTETSLDRFDGQSFTHYVNDPYDPGSLNTGPQRMVAQDVHGAVWTGTYGGGLSRLDGQRFTHFRHDPQNPDSLAVDNISNIVPDTKGGLWVGVHGKGIDYFDGQHFTHFTPDPTNPAGLPSPWIVPLLLDQRGMLWIATASMGLVRLDTKTQKFTTYLLDPTQPGSQAVNWTQDIYFDGAVMWVASPTGLFRFDPDSAAFTHHYTEKDGLVNNSVVAVLGDNQGHVWVATVKGLSRFDPKTETFRHYDVFDGLQSNEFSIASRAKASDGQLFFGGTNGFNAFYPERMVDNLTLPPVVLTDFELFNKPVQVGGKESPLQQAIHVAQHVTLRHDQSVFSFQFAALSYTLPQKNRYAYRLEGFDKDWQYTDANRRFATYTNLDPGNYVFQVKASNNDGVWNERGTALQITIMPPWWETWWFRSTAIVAVLGLAFTTYWLRVSRLKRYSQELERLVAERTAQLEATNKELDAFAHSVSHDLRAPLRHINGFLEMLQESIGPALDEQSRHYMANIFDAAGRMNMLIDDLLSFSRMSRQELSKSEVKLGKLVEDVILEFKPETKGRDITWKILPLPTVIGDRAMLRMVLVNLLSNALKYTRPRPQAVIEIGWMPGQGEEIVVFVRDNGVGFDMQHAEKLFGVFQRLHRSNEFEGTGIGLSNVRRIIERHGGRTWAMGEVEHGATFYFSLPQSSKG
ncbi:MAG: two-component regulator propeller domain-containing protein [Chloroflexota bacterium]